MNLTKYNAMKPGLNFFDDIFDDFFNWDQETKKERGIRFTQPLSNILELKDKFVIELAIPGMSKDDIKIDIDNDQLIISASIESKDEESKEDYSRREFYYGNFSKSFHLPESINRDAITARFENGVLSIDLMKKEEAIDKGPLHIEIK